MIHANRVGLAAGLGIMLVVGGTADAAAPKNVILFISDGMSSEQVRAAGYYFNGQAGQFSFEQLDHFAWMTTNNSAGGVTGSDASGTALATGYKVNNNVISVAIASGPDPRSATPSDGRALTTLLEVYKAQGKRTGLVTNSYLTDATPAAFGAHVPDRGQTTVIANQFLNQSRPDVLMGGTGHGFTLAGAAAAGYTTVSNRAELQAIDLTTAGPIAGGFGELHMPSPWDATTGNTFYATNPFLQEMTTSAIDLLSRDGEGFFLMVENQLPDRAGHLQPTDETKIPRMLYAVRELDDAVQRAVAFSQANPDTLIIVASDHETGGWVTTRNNGIGVIPGVVSGQNLHNATMVPTYASGPNAGHVLGLIDNTDLFRIVTTTEAPPAFESVHTLRFRQGVDGYVGVRDSEFSSAAPSVSHFATPELVVVSGTTTRQVVVSFSDLVGSAAIPADAQIISAILTIHGGADGATNTSIRAHRLLVPFDEHSTFANIGNVAGNGLSLNGPGTEDDDYLATAEDVFPAPSINAVGMFDVTESLIAWLAAQSAGESSQLGWVLINNGTNTWGVHASETALAAYRPMLEVTFGIVPEPAALGALACLGLALGRRRRIASVA